MNETIISIKYPFSIDRSLGTLMEERIYAQHVRQMMIQVLMTSPGERVNRPDFGCGLRRLVFAPNSDASANLMQVMVMQSLDKWLGTLIEVLEVKVTAVNERMEVNVVYMIKATQQRQYLNIEVTV